MEPYLLEIEGCFMSLGARHGWEDRGGKVTDFDDSPVKSAEVL